MYNRNLIPGLNAIKINHDNTERILRLPLDKKILIIQSRRGVLYSSPTKSGLSI